MLSEAAKPEISGDIGRPPLETLERLRLMLQDKLAGWRRLKKDERRFSLLMCGYRTTAFGSQSTEIYIITNYEGPGKTPLEAEARTDFQLFACTVASTKCQVEATGVNVTQQHVDPITRLLKEGRCTTAGSGGRCRRGHPS